MLKIVKNTIYAIGSLAIAVLMNFGMLFALVGIYFLSIIPLEGNNNV